jgi:hypothetical protein
MLNVSEYINPIKAERHTVTNLLRKIYSTARDEGFYTLKCTVLSSLHNAGIIKGTVQAAFVFC